MHPLLHLQARLLTAAAATAATTTATATPTANATDEDGQATAEYALVLLGVAAIALLVVGWASKTDTVGRLLDAVFGQLIDRNK